MQALHKKLHRALRISSLMVTWILVVDVSQMLVAVKIHIATVCTRLVIHPLHRLIHLIHCRKTAVTAMIANCSQT